MKDRVPEVGIEVLVCLKRGNIEIRCRRNEEYEDEQDPCARYVWSDQGMINDVLAWMPLPQPPKKEKGN